MGFGQSYPPYVEQLLRVGVVVPASLFQVAKDLPRNMKAAAGLFIVLAPDDVAPKAAPHHVHYNGK